MVEWGISGNSHDAALAVFVDSKLVFATEAERFNRVKNSPDLSYNLVSYAKYMWGEPEQVYWYENPYKKTARQLIAGQGWLWSENNIPKYLSNWGINAPVTYINHHHSHAAAGYFTSKFDDACVLVIDAIGEFETMSIWEAHGDKLEKLWSQSYPHSIGLFYSAMTKRIGLKPNEEEYILMGMAAYGKHRDYLHAMHTDFVDDHKKFTFKKNFHKGCDDWRPDVTEDFELAATTQLMYEQMFYDLLEKARSLTNSKNLVLMGGCALNCLANRFTGNFFDQTWIMPAPGDSGSAIGAVLAKKKVKISFENTFLGYDMGKVDSDYDIVDYLLANKICGIARGRAEFGPRALGNRSLIADPRGDDIKDRVNQIKQRQEFRPFAPIILEEHVHNYFEMPKGWDTSPFMQVVAKCKSPKSFPAIVHVDGTSRVQTVGKDAGGLRKVLELWYAKTNCPMLLNTSLNIKGQPMVNTIADAREFELQHSVKVFS
jgi:carbamoyltransferase